MSKNIVVSVLVKGHGAYAGVVAELKVLRETPLALVTEINQKINIIPSTLSERKGECIYWEKDSKVRKFGRDIGGQHGTYYSIEKINTAEVASDTSKRGRKPKTAELQVKETTIPPEALEPPKSIKIESKRDGLHKRMAASFMGLRK